MEGLEKLIEKWELDLKLWRNVVDEPLFHTKETQLQAKHNCLVICAILGDLKELKDKITKKN